MPSPAESRESRGPVTTGATPPDRIATLDAVRGVAVMGILFMNILAFSMIGAAYDNPTAYGGATGPDLAAWCANFILFDGKMRGLFSLLFGASLLLVIERARASGRDEAQVHFHRMFWLFLFGLGHLYFIWWGDILAHYALLGVIAYGFRNLSTGKLVALGIALAAAEWFLLFSLSQEIVALQGQIAHGQADNAAQLRWQDFVAHFGRPAPATVAEDLALHRSGYGAILADRFAHEALTPLNLLFFLGPETLGYMLLGMAALKSGLLSGAWTGRRYALWAAAGLSIGGIGYGWLAWFEWRHDFSTAAVAMAVQGWSPPFRLAMMIGWACLIVLLTRRGGVLSVHLAAAGRMAFSNYLLTSLICTSLFYGYGLGLYGHLSRAALYPIVLVVCAVMLLWSRPWLTRFRYGPLEWLWRSLARREWQPFAR